MDQHCKFIETNPELIIENARKIVKNENLNGFWKRVGTNAFFLPPFFPLEIRLFLPTAMVSLFAEIRERVLATAQSTATMAPF